MQQIPQAAAKVSSVPVAEPEKDRTKRNNAKRDRASNKKKVERLNRKSDITMLSMCVPTLIKLLIFQYLPMIGILIAFQEYKPSKYLFEAGRGVFGSKFVGFKNFEFFFKGVAAEVTFNTLAYNAVFIVTGLVFSVVLALILFEVSNKKVVKSFQTVVFFPYFISWALVGLILTSMLNSSGMVTNLVLQLTGKKIDFYSTPGYWRFILPVVNIWKGCGVSAIIYYANMLSVSNEYYEAAYLDGASKLQCARHITLPFIMPMIVTLTLLSLGGIIRSDFGIFYFATRNSQLLYPATTVIDTYVYRALESLGDFSMSTAIGLYQSVIGFILVIVSNKIVQKRDAQRALF